MKKINTRQLIIFYLIYSFAIKLLKLPSLLDGWLTAALGMLIELAVLFVVLLAIERKGNVKVLMPLLFLFFLLQVLITLAHTNFLLGRTLYEDLNKHMFIIPMILLGAVFVFSKTRAVFRSGEIFYILIAIAVVLAVLPAIPKVDITETVPTLDFRNLLDNLIYFEGALILLMFGGEVDIGKNFKRNFMGWALFGAVVFVAFVFFYNSLFGPLASLRPLGIVDVTGQNAYLAQNFRLEWIIVCVWLLLLSIRFGVLFHGCFLAVRSKKVHSAFFAIPLAVLVYLLFLFLPLESVHRALTIPIAIFIFAVPLLFLILGGRKENVKA
jgi:hypothetical protein